MRRRQHICSLSHKIRVIKGQHPPSKICQVELAIWLTRLNIQLFVSSGVRTNSHQTSSLYTSGIVVIVCFFQAKVKPTATPSPKIKLNPQLLYPVDSFLYIFFTSNLSYSYTKKLVHCY